VRPNTTLLSAAVKPIKHWHSHWLQDDNHITVADITQLYVREQDNPELLHRAAHSSTPLKLNLTCWSRNNVTKKEFNHAEHHT
jgi:hypothetical protein